MAWRRGLAELGVAVQQRVCASRYKGVTAEEPWAGHRGKEEVVVEGEVVVVWVAWR